VGRAVRRTRRPGGRRAVGGEQRGAPSGWSWRTWVGGRGLEDERKGGDVERGVGLGAQQLASRRTCTHRPDRPSGVATANASRRPLGFQVGPVRELGMMDALGRSAGVSATRPSPCREGPAGGEGQAACALAFLVFQRPLPP